MDNSLHLILSYPPWFTVRTVSTHSLSAVYFMTVSLAASDSGGQEGNKGLERIDPGSECKFTLQRMVCVTHIPGFSPTLIV